jgi:hypothetical protein
MATNSATALATQQSIKAYVDAQQDTVDTLAEILALGNATGGTNIAFGDNDKAIFGAESDLQIYHDGLNSYITDSGTGNLNILANEFALYEGNGTDLMIGATPNGAVTLSHDATTKLATTATGIDVTGSVGIGISSPLGQLHINTETAEATKVYVDGEANQPKSIEIRHYDTSEGSGAGRNLFYLKTPASDRLDIGNFTDGSSETQLMTFLESGNVGIGATSPLNSLHIQDSALNKMLITNDDYVNGSAGTSFDVSFGATSGNTYSEIRHLINGRSAWGDFVLARGGGNVGIGTSSPSSALEVVGGASLGSGFTQSRSGHPTFGITNGGTDSVYFSLAPDGGSHQTFMQVRDDDTDVSSVAFSTSGSEAMRIDSSGNALFGKTVANNTDAGTTIYNDNGISVVRDSNTTAIFNRLTNDGEIITIRKDSATVGSIGTVLEDSLSRLYIAQSDTGLKFNNGPDYIVPCTSSGANRDDVIDLGASGARFSDIYATNGTIQTSDRNEKQDIEALSETEQRVAVAAKGLLRKFRWKSSVAEKGDEARIHFGIIAQDLQAAFEAEGLDAGRYGMFINSTWTDEKTGEERSRMGVRYSELLAFIISAI